MALKGSLLHPVEYLGADDTEVSGRKHNPTKLNNSSSLALDISYEWNKYFPNTVI